MCVPPLANTGLPHDWKLSTFPNSRSSASSFSMLSQSTICLSNAFSVQSRSRVRSRVSCGPAPQAACLTFQLLQTSHELHVALMDLQTDRRLPYRTRPEMPKAWAQVSAPTLRGRQRRPRHPRQPPRRLAPPLVLVYHQLPSLSRLATYRSRRCNVSRRFIVVTVSRVDLRDQNRNTFVVDRE